MLFASCEEETGMTLHREDDKDYRFAFDCVMRPETEQREVYVQSSGQFGVVASAVGQLLDIVHVFNRHNRLEHRK